MNGYNFTMRVRKVLAIAREEAARLHHEYVGTEHILLALLRDDGIASTVMQNLVDDLDELRDGILRLSKPDMATTPTGPDLPYSSRAKKVLELAMSEAHGLDHEYVGTEHLLLGVLKEKNGVGAQALVAAGITLETARAETKRILGIERSEDERVTPTRENSLVGHTDQWQTLPEPVRTVVGSAYGRAAIHGANVPTLADLLEAIILSSPVVSAAFTSREIEIDALIADVRSNE